MKVAIIGAGWAGMAAAVKATEAGHQVTIFESTQALGGRARALSRSPALVLPNGAPAPLDNGQHILIGAYTETLQLMRLVGLSPEAALLDMPMTLQFPDGLGLAFANLPTPLDALVGILQARGWSLADKWALLSAALGWKLKGFRCEDSLSVAGLCLGLTPRVKTELIEPLCVSALNTLPEQASGQVFLRVLQDALLGVPGGSHLLLPKVDLSALFPDAAASWVLARGGLLKLGQRVASLATHGQRWLVQGELFDAVLLATSAHHAAQIIHASGLDAPPFTAAGVQHWVETTQALQHEAIATVYAWAPQASLPLAMLALRSSAQHPAQFVFDRGQLGGPPGLLAFVVSAAQGERATLQAQVLAQARAQLGLALEAVQTVVEKRATFACTPGLQRPPSTIAPGLLACGDHVAGPYPATLEGAVRSGAAAVALL
ncbi:hydroxysqualene dehydroxylase HpnE [Rhodoferax sp.]|uniref:hydroxysqualene dehydroxylase HpnE n=1 Tax=Rhodoferax sp. TaxID=50421 RepID=UPI002735AA5A|nr:hydroxysqualene dehydroxylase HpnE [Rhodoferax sp.]MDP3191676.1 hydroxysqualene dehydroxylase HpnE [Rhodoferax sp.]MDP3335592.1 hydroxysqualene dehydroxylase HpnE [Rhodoferax sp.]